VPHLQLKDIPAGTHEALRARAKLDGISMREYVLRLIEVDVGRGREEREKQLLDTVLKR
jgi:hypothetical protein